MTERPLVFSCGGEPLVGVLSLPEGPPEAAVVIVVGGPQYRAGSHRQFVELARALAQGGMAVLRFDYRGMGDSAAPLRTFESVDEDLRAATDAMLAAVADVDGVVLWGLCDGASAAWMYAALDPRVQAVVAVNPWVRTEASLAVARINHHYKRRLLSREFWFRLLSGKVAVGSALGGLLSALGKRLRGTSRGTGGAGAKKGFIERMEAGWERMQGHSLVVLSGNDLTAREFFDFCRARPVWHKAVAAGPDFAEVAQADHTFSRRDWQHTLEQLSLDWLRRRHASSADSSRSEALAHAGASNIQRSA